MSLQVKTFLPSPVMPFLSLNPMATLLRRVITIQGMSGSRCSPLGFSNFYLPQAEFAESVPDWIKRQFSSLLHNRLTPWVARLPWTSLLGLSVTQLEPKIVGPGFHQRVYDLVRRVPAGRVSTYGQIVTQLEVREWRDMLAGLLRRLRTKTPTSRGIEL